MILGYLFLAIKAEDRLSAFMSFSNLCIAGEAEMGETTNVFVPHLFLAIVTEVSYVADMACPNFFFAFCTKSSYITDVTVSNFFLQS